MLDLEQTMLTETFQGLLERERQARDAYADLIAQASDPEAREQLEQIHREKQRHVELVERLLEIVQ